MFKKSVLVLGVLVLIPVIAAAALPQLKLSGPKVKILDMSNAPDALGTDPGFADNGPGMCHRQDASASGGFFNVEVLRQTSNRWILAIQGPPTIHGCGPGFGHPTNHSGDQMYLYMTKNGPLGDYRPIAYKLRNATGPIECSDSKASNIGLFLNGQADIQACDLDEGFWGIGSMTRTSHTGDLIVPMETGALQHPTALQPSWRSYFRIMKNNGTFPSTARHLIMDTEAINIAHAKPYMFRVSGNDLFMPFFFNHFNPDFSDGALGFGAIRFGQFPSPNSTWVMDGAGSMYKLNNATRAVLTRPFKVDTLPNQPTDVAPKNMCTVITPWTWLNGSQGFNTNYTVFYTAARNGSGPSCEDPILGGDGKPKESVIGYSSFSITTDPSNNAPVFGGYIEHKIVQDANGVEVQFNGFDSIQHVSVVPTSASGGYIFWAEATACVEPQHKGVVVYASAYTLQ